MSKRRDYCNEVVPWWCPTPLFEGARDAWRCPFERRLYRRPLWRHALWRIGNLAVKAVYSRKTRLSARAALSEEGKA